MNKRALIIGLVYSVAVIIFRMIILLGGYTFSRFGFFYSYFVSILAIVPFLILAVYLVRQKDYGGLISGRDSMRIALTVLAVSAIVLSVYNYIEVPWKLKDIAVDYYNSPDYIKVLEEAQAKAPDKIKTEQFPQIIKDQIASVSGGRAATSKLFPLIIIGLAASFVTSMFMKRGQKANLN